MDELGTYCPTCDTAHPDGTCPAGSQRARMSLRLRLRNAARGVGEYNRQVQALFLVCEKDKPRFRAAMAEARRLVELDSVAPIEAVRRVKHRLVLASGNPYEQGPIRDLPQEEECE
jgi:hypothetical protein